MIAQHQTLCPAMASRQPRHNAKAGGDTAQTRSDAKLVPWHSIGEVNLGW